jgi:tetratricopeptide (TPR) repeat protein
LDKGDYEKAHIEYEQAIKLLETALPDDHPDLARSIHNIGLTYERQGNIQNAIQYFDQAMNIAQGTLSSEHPLINLINNSQNRVSNIVESYITVRL